ncbi:MAG: hypothetical protein EA360_06630 [Balneolaceae bacterium]|nr:MAG: hypothetical protein EA360_06630 [Balneolaceae bacterium]
MIFKKIFGKTLDAAKKSAMQMYGENYKVYDESEGEEEAGITVVVDEKKRAGRNPHQEPKKSEGVHFERSDLPEGIDENKIAPQLEALRKIAEEQSRKKEETRTVQKRKNQQFRQVLTKPTDTMATQQSLFGSKETPLTTYSRKSVRPAAALPESSMNENKQNKQSPARASEITQTADPDQSGRSLLNQFDQTGPRLKKPLVKPKPAEQKSETPPSRSQEREISALHKRFDRLESLLGQHLLSSNIRYISHPAFQQLLRTGIPVSLVTEWFTAILNEGIDPHDQTKRFMARLSEILKGVLSVDSSAEPRKFQLFTGPAGSGKTHLIMKLLLHSDFLKERKACVITLTPPKEKGPYYTILKPFCKDHKIPLFEVTGGMDITDRMEEWSDYEFVLIDTPSLQIEQESSFREYWKVRQMMAPLTPLEVHFVVNVARNKHYFSSTSSAHHPLQPDYIALTHLDEIAELGSVIPFLNQMDASARYVSTGTEIPGSIDTFKPKRFAQKLLQEE